MNAEWPNPVEAVPSSRESNGATARDSGDAAAGSHPLSNPPTSVLDAGPKPAPESGPGSGPDPAASANPRRTTHHHEVLIMLQATLVSLVAALFVLTFIVQPYRIPSGSMENTLLIGDFLLVNKAIFANPGPWGSIMPYEPVRRDDIVVFHYPVDDSMYLVKRTIAVPGDRIHLLDGQVFVNGRQQKESFALYIASYPSAYRDDFPTASVIDPAAGARWRAEMKRDVQRGNLIVPAGRYFVLGDNRNDSLDSRYWGFVPRQNIVGEPFLVYFSVVSRGRSEIAGRLNDRLPEERSWWGSLIGSVRWYRIFHVIH